MENSLDLFLNPHRKPHLKFKFETFGDAEFEMKILSAEEGAAASIESQEKGLKGISIYFPTLVGCLVTPDLHDTAFLNALSKREGHKIMSAIDALKTVFTSDEISSLIKIYDEYSSVTVDFSEKVEEVKN